MNEVLLWESPVMRNTSTTASMASIVLLALAQSQATMQQRQPTPPSHNITFGTPIELGSVTVSGSPPPLAFTDNGTFAAVLDAGENPIISYFMPFTTLF